MRRTVAGAVLALALLAACSDDETPETAPTTQPPGDRSDTDVIPAAVDATLAEGSARLEATTEIEDLVGAGDEPLLAEAEGLVDFEGRTSSLAIDLASVLEGLGLPGLEGEVESRSVGDDRWLRSPFFNTVLGVPTEWLLLDVGPADGQAAGVSQLGALIGNDPTDQLRLLAGIDPDSVEEAGEEDVRGESTTRYTATIDPETVLDGVPESDRERLAPLVEQLGTGPVDVEVWLDDDGRIRRLATTVPLPPAAGGGQANVRLDLFDFGVDVDVEAPPAEDVTPASEVTNPGP